MPMFAQGIGIGKLFGIRILLDWSLIFVFLLVTFNLAAGVFPSWHPDWTPLLDWMVALAAAVLLFASVLAHELAHALVGRAQGAEVRSITLFLFGGMANIEREPSSPGAEALMAAVGPLASILLGIAFSVAGVLVTVYSGPDRDPMIVAHHAGPVATLLLWLGPVNVFLGVFNLLPGFPLDGGRILRALLWRISGNLRRATRWATRAGQALAWFLIFLGIAMVFGAYIPFLGGGFVAGLWLAFIGWFLNSAAVMSYRQLVIQGLLEGVPVSRVMRRRPPAAIDPSTTVSTLVDEHIMPSGEQVFRVVAPDGALLGVVQARDVRTVPRDQWGQTPVSAIAADLISLPVIRPDAGAFEALRMLSRIESDELLVADNGHIEGVIRRQDIAHWMELQCEDESGRRAVGLHRGAGGLRPSSG